MLLTLKSALLAVFSTIFFLSAAAPVQAQPHLVSVGAGRYLAANQTDVLRFAYYVSEQPNGDVEGLAIWRGPDAVIIFRVSSYLIIPGTDTLAFAGTVVAIFGNPAPGQEVGSTAFTAFKDNGPGAVDETASLTVLPLSFGSLTIQQIIGAIGPPPPAAYRPLLSGNVWIF